MLRRGYFCQRPIFLSLTEKVESIIRGMPYQDDAKLPIFWIGGRSGTGKSIALLYVLSQLFDRGYEHILWVGHGDDIRNLPLAVRHALELRQSSDQQVIIGIDDPHIPASQNEASRYWQQAVDLLRQPMQEFEPEKIPVIVCCGPTEQKELFERDNIRPDQVRLYGETIPQASGDDYELLCDYYRSRVGREPPNTGGSDILLTQLFFEWESGIRLTEFAERFKQRIQFSDFSQEKELYNLLSEILSLNRLYAAYPVEVAQRRLAKMSAGAMLAFENLLEENHLQVLNEADNHRGSGYFMQHPHVANAIYEIWHPEKPAKKRQKHLKTAIENIFEYNGNGDEEARLAPVWSLSNSLEPNSPTAARLDSEIVRNLVAPLYRSYRKSRPVLIDSLAVWVDLYVRCRNLEPDRKLHENPIHFALDKIRNASPKAKGLINLCYKFLQLFYLLDKSEKTSVLYSILEQLKLSPEWEDWPLMWDRLRKFTSMTPVYKAENQEEQELVKEVVETDFSWVEDLNNQNNYYWQQVWAGLPKLNRKGRMTVRFFKLTERWLNRTPTHHSWYFIWNNCRRTNRENKFEHWIEERLLAASTDWLRHALENNFYHPFWNKVWRAVFQETVDKQLLADLFEKYLRDTNARKSSNNSWGWSLDKLIQYYETFSPEEYKSKISALQPDLVKWLNISLNEPSLWPHLWAVAHQIEPFEKQVIDMGKTWLSNITSDYRAVRRVWTPLFEITAPNNPEMVTIGERLLTEFTRFYNDKPRNSWPIIWLDLWDAAENRNHEQISFRLRLMEYGKAWIEEAAAIDCEKVMVWDVEDINSWKMIWSRIEEVCTMEESFDLHQLWIGNSA